MQEGMPYLSLRKTITINLLDFKLLSNNDAFHNTEKSLNTKTHQVLNDDIEIHFVEIPKLVKQYHVENLNQWEKHSLVVCYYFQHMKVNI